MIPHAVTVTMASAPARRRGLIRSIARSRTLGSSRARLSYLVNGALFLFVLGAIWTDIVSLLAGVCVLLLWGLRAGVTTDCLRMRREPARRATVLDLTTRSELLDAVIRAAPIVISVKDAAGRIVLLNGEAAAPSWSTAEAFLGKTDRDLYPDDQADRIQTQDEQAKRSKGSPQKTENKAR